MALQAVENVIAEAEEQEDEVAALLDRLTERLNGYRGHVEQDPLSNPIRLMASSLWREIQDGELTQETLERCVQKLTERAFHKRAMRLRSFLGEVDPEVNAGRLKEALRRAFDEVSADGAKQEDLERLLNRVAFGFVITAHPTFSLARHLQEKLVALAIGRDPYGRPLDEDSAARLLGEVEAAHHVPENRLDLDEEHRQALVAIRNLRSAVCRLYEIVFELLGEMEGIDPRKIRPRLVSLATWVGYDTDGRSDITWAMTFSKRIACQLDQLRYYRQRLEELAQSAAEKASARSVLELIEARLDLAIKTMEDALEAFSAPELSQAPTRELAAVSRDLARGGQSRLSDRKQLSALIERAIDAADEPALQRQLLVLRAEIDTHGLTCARTHLRINATQLHNAIRKTIEMDHSPDDPSYRSTYTDAVVRLIEQDRSQTINFGTIAAERASARRAFMLIAQMLKYLDGSESVRFLIAECESPITLIIALYFAKLFGIDERIDISPLFETKKALERGAEVLRDALNVPAYRSYIEKRGRLCIQTGFSDAGRYLGQIAASVAIERLRLGLAEVLAEQHLSDIEVVIFDTHGESIGRGAHPSSIADRLRYYSTPHSRHLFEGAGLEVTQEASFQGGDGYLYFLREESALAVLTAVLEDCLPRSHEVNDPFYREERYVDEFFSAIRQFNDRVIEDPCYAVLLGAFGPNLLYPTGSRALKRQHERSVSAAAILEHPSQLRAIPHNSILQQVGILANTIGGVGQAVAKNPDFFQKLYRESRRFRRLMTMVEHGFKYTDLDVTKAYLDIFDPGMWLRRAQLERHRDTQENLRAVAAFLEQMALHDKLVRIIRVFMVDYIGLADALREHRRLTRETGEQPIVIDSDARDNLHLLHALRQAIIQALMMQSTRVPDFSDRHAETHDAVIIRLMRLEVEPALSLLEEVFPSVELTDKLDYGEPSSYAASSQQSYVVEHDTLFEPIRQKYDLIRRIGSGIVHHLGALG